jgi:SAM-dependent methyltransferase
MAKGKRVLDLGCVDHTLSTRQSSYWLHGIIRQHASYVLGLDYEREEIERLKTEGYHVVWGDAVNFSLQETFDLIVAGEIIEHLTCPRGLLDCAKSHLRPGGKLILTCPNANNILFFIENCLLGYEYDNSDHTCLFTPRTMTVLLRKCGYRPVCFHFVAENFFHSKSTVLEKMIAHAMWALQVAAGLIRPSLCKNFITIAEPLA